MKSIATGEVSEPVRLLAGGGTAYERRLLESADLDAMPSATPERLAQALAAPGAFGARPLGAPGAIGRWRARRWVRLGGLSGLGGLGLAALLAGRAPPPASPAVAPPMPIVSASSAVESVPSTLGVLPAAVVEPTATTPPSLRAGPDGAPQRPRAALALQQPARGSARSTARGSGGLLDEVRLLESTRDALRAGHSAAARRSLDEYRARFGHGELGFEADLLEAEWATSAGEPGRARELAEALLARPGAARYRERLRRLLKRTPPAASRALGSETDGAHMERRRSNP